MKRRVIKKKGCCPKCLCDFGTGNIVRLRTGRWKSRFWFCCHCGYCADGKFYPEGKISLNQDDLDRTYEEFQRTAAQNIEASE